MARDWSPGFGARVVAGIGIVANVLVRMSANPPVIGDSIPELSGASFVPGGKRTSMTAPPKRQKNRVFGPDQPIEVTGQLSNAGPMALGGWVTPEDVCSSVTCPEKRPHAMYSPPGLQ